MSAVISVTLDDVRSAIEALRNADPKVKPGVNAVRDHLGRGSWSTIQKFLKAIQDEEKTRNAAASALPPNELIEVSQRLLLDLWKRVQVAAERQEQHLVAQLRNEIVECEQRINISDSLAAEATAQVERCEAAIEATRLDCEAKLEMALSQRDAANAAVATLKTDHASAVDRLETRISELESALAVEQRSHTAAATQRDQALSERDRVASDATDERRRHQDQIEDLRHARDQAVLRGDRLESLIKEASEVQGRLRDELAQMREDLTSSQSRAINAEAECSAIRPTLETLRQENVGLLAALDIVRTAQRSQDGALPSTPKQS